MTDPGPSAATTTGHPAVGEVLEAAIVKEADALRVAIAMHRLERAPRAVHVGYYGECCVRREALARRLSEAHPAGRRNRTPGSAALQMLDADLLEMARHTTTHTPEEPFLTDV